MSVYYYEPFYHFDRFFENLAGRSSGTDAQLPAGAHAETPMPVVVRPKMDLHEDTAKNTVTATFEVPGLKKEDVNIDVHDGRLIISGETKLSTEHEEGGYAVRERKFGRFSRTLRLPQGVKEEEIKAALADGVLTVTFPKAGVDTVPKKIAIA